MGADFMNNKSGSERLKAWVHWKLLEKDLDEDDKQFALDIQDLQKLCEEQRGEIERLKQDASGKAICIIHDSRMCLDCEAWWKKRFSEIKTDLANLKESCKCGKVRPLNNKVEGR